MQQTHTPPPLPRLLYVVVLPLLLLLLCSGCPSLGREARGVRRDAERHQGFGPHEVGEAARAQVGRETGARAEGECPTPPVSPPLPSLPFRRPVLLRSTTTLPLSASRYLFFFSMVCTCVPLCAPPCSSLCTAVGPLPWPMFSRNLDFASIFDQAYGRGGTPVFTCVFEPLARVTLYLTDENGLDSCFGAA